MTTAVYIVFFTSGKVQQAFSFSAVPPHLTVDVGDLLLQPQNVWFLSS